jgi:putative PIN family toxin of toxin-antitoxin system
VLRAVLDANVVVSALIRPDGPSGRVVERAVRGDGVRAVVSRVILDEYRRALSYPKVRKYVRFPAAEVSVWVDALALVSDTVPGERRVSVVDADPDDDAYVAAALEGRASFIVSGDRHLLDVRAHEGVRIVTPRAFLDVLVGA